jgi:hypothetical protein
VQEHGCAALLYLALAAALKGAIASAGSIEAVVRARDAFPDDERLRSAADRALLQRLQQPEEQNFLSSLSSLFYK